MARPLLFPRSGFLVPRSSGQFFGFGQRGVIVRLLRDFGHDLGVGDGAVLVHHEHPCSQEMGGVVNLSCIGGLLDGNTIQQSRDGGLLFQSLLQARQSPVVAHACCIRA